MATQQGKSGPTVPHNTGVLYTLLAGAVFVALADWIPHLVNGILILILVGVILRSASRWTPVFNGAVQAL